MALLRHASTIVNKEFHTFSTLLSFASAHDVIFCAVRVLFSCGLNADRCDVLEESVNVIGLQTDRLCRVFRLQLYSLPCLLLPSML